MTTEDMPVKAMKTTFNIIVALRELDGAASFELAERLNMPTSTVHDHLRMFANEEYLLNDDGVYRVDTRFIELSKQVRNRMKGYTVARSEVDELAEKTDEHANLMIKENQ